MTQAAMKHEIGKEAFFQPRLLVDDHETAKQRAGHLAERLGAREGVIFGPLNLRGRVVSLAPYVEFHFTAQVIGYRDETAGKNTSASQGRA